MRIPCPYCGDRTHAEFNYLGDAAITRPTPAGDGVDHDATLFADYVYLRNNPPGRHHEFWQHVGGCRAWLVVERDTTTHAIGRVVPARDRTNGGFVTR